MISDLQWYDLLFFFTVMVLKQYTLSRNCTQNCNFEFEFFFSRASDMWYNTLSCNAGQGILGDWAPSKPVNHYCSVAQLCPTLCDPMDCSMPGFPVLHHLPKLAHTHVHWVSDVIQSSHPLSSPSPYLHFKEIHLTFFIERGIVLDFIVIIIEEERQGWSGGWW